VSSTDCKWLVKSNDLINGPYEFNEVVENIFKGDVHLLDEIKGPFERWRPIRDHSLFAAAIEKLKATTYARREVTITETVDLGTHTVDLTQTSTETLGESTNTMTSTSSQTASGINMNTNTGISAPPVNNRRQSHSQGVPKPKAIPKQKSRFPMAFIMTFIVIMVGAAGMLLFEAKKAKTVEKNISNFDKYTDQGLIHLKIGQYKEALSFFNSAYEISPDDPNLILEMSPLLIQFDGQFGQVQVMIENLLATRHQKEFMKKGKNIVGMSLSYRARYNDALDELNKSLSFDDQYYPSLVNKGYVLLKLGKSGEAIKVLEKAVKVSPREALARYLLTRGYIQEGFRTGKKQYFSEALSTSNEYAQQFSDFRQEVLFLVAVAKMELNSPLPELTAAVRRFLEVDTELTAMHVHNVEYDFQSFNWLDYSELCKGLAQKLDQFNSAMLQGFCELKTGNITTAKTSFERILSQNKNDGGLQALYVSTLFLLNNVAQAKNSINFIAQVDKPKPLVQSLLRGCLVAKDLVCVEKIMKSPYAKQLSLLYSYWSIAELNHGQSVQKTQKSISQGLNLSPSFAPLLKLRRQL
jgi:tetratricopeptide (TPR) repeat protein